MIKITMRRDKDGQDYDQGERNITVSKAFENLFEYEIGYGGNVIELSKTKIVVKTGVMACVDTTVVEGSEEEMKPLVRAISVFLIVAEKTDEKNLEEAWERINIDGFAVPFMVAIATPIFIGESRLKKSLIVLSGVNNEDEVKVAAKQNSRDLLAIASLKIENPNMSFSKILTAVTP